MSKDASELPGSLGVAASSFQMIERSASDAKERFSVSVAALGELVANLETIISPLIAEIRDATDQGVASLNKAFKAYEEVLPHFAATKLEDEVDAKALRTVATVGWIGHSFDPLKRQVLERVLSDKDNPLVRLQAMTDRLTDDARKNQEQFRRRFFSGDKDSFASVSSSATLARRALVTYYKNKHT
jgi:hypothetical protein